MHKPTVLLLGASGFIGKNIAEQLRPQYQLVTPSHAELDLCQQDAVETFLKKLQPEIIIHAAASGTSIGGVTTTGTLKNDVLAFYSLLRCTAYFGKLILFGSGAEYDKRRSLQQVREADFGMAIPSDDYGLAKYIISTTAKSFNNIVVLRLFGVFGKYESTQRFLSQAILANLAGKPITIHQDMMFDYLWIEDLVAIITYVLSHQLPQNIYNVGSGKPLRLSQYAALINTIAEKKSRICIEKQAPNFWYAPNIARLQETYRAFSPTPITQSLAALYEWYRSQPALWHEN